MRVYLVRHGKAAREGYATDEARPLTKRGRGDAERIAAQVARAQIEIQQIRHSGVLRAQQTADIFAQAIRPTGGVVRVPGLLWDDPVEAWVQALPAESAPVMLVGHNPFMEELASLLLTGSPDGVPVHFTTSGTACLEYMGGQIGRAHV